MEGNGAVDYLNPDGSEGELVGATVAECIAACDITLGCVGFKYKPFDGNKCFLRSSITTAECAHSPGQETWVYVGAINTDWQQYADKNCVRREVASNPGLSGDRAVTQRPSISCADGRKRRCGLSQP